MKKNKFLVCVLAFTVLLSTVSLSSHASSWKSISKVVTSNFTKNWTAHFSERINGYEATMTYGFNTWLVNEDTCSTLYYGSYHRPVIINGSGEHYGQSMQAHEWSDFEVKHSGNTVTYKLEYEVLR